MENVTEFRPCGDCTACCSGQLVSNSYGNQFGRGHRCIFLVEEKCTVYETRPQVCRNYQCAWSQNLLDHDMRPDQSGIMVSVETDKNKKQYFKAMDLIKTVPYETYIKLDRAAKKFNTYWIRVPYQDEHNIYDQRRSGACDCSNPCS